MPRATDELVGEFDFIERSYPASDGQIKILPGRLIDGTRVVGYVDEFQLIKGITYLFRGYWTNHETYGKQFLFESCGIAQPVGQRGIVNYLQRAPGIGRQIALKIWDKYGRDSLDALRERPEEISAAIAGLTESKAKDAAGWLNDHKDREIVTRGLEEIGLTKRQQTAAIEKWGARAAEVIKENAFALMIIPGVGFGKADKYFLDLGGNPSDVKRVGWCAWNALHKEKDGSTWHDPKICVMAVRRSVAGMKVSPSEGIAWAIGQGVITERIDSTGNIWLAESGRARAELRLANCVYKAIAEDAK